MAADRSYPPAIGCADPLEGRFVGESAPRGLGLRAEATVRPPFRVSETVIVALAANLAGEAAAWLLLHDDELGCMDGLSFLWSATSEARLRL